MLVERFEDLRAWQAARELSGQVYAITSAAQFRGKRSLADQMERASVSCMANLAEGFHRRTRGELSHFFDVAIALASEVQSHLYVALDRGLCNPEVFREAYDQALKVQRLARAFLLKRSSAATFAVHEVDR